VDRYSDEKYTTVTQLNNVKGSVFWDITPCSPLRVIRRLGGACRLHLQGREISQARNEKIEATYSSETSVDFQRTTRGYIELLITAAVRTPNPTTKQHYSQLLTSNGPGEAVYVGLSTDASWQFHWQLQLFCRQVVLSLFKSNILT
jgi:hypothetical protein